VEPSEEAAMAYVMCQYDRPTDTRNWTEYNKHVRDWCQATPRFTR